MFVALCRARGYRVQVPLGPKSFFGAHICSDPIQIRGILMPADRITDPLMKNAQKKQRMTNMSKLTCERSIKPFNKNLFSCLKTGSYKQMK